MITVRRAGTDDAAAVHTLAAATFALACPPGILQTAIDAFVDRNLSKARMAQYLADPSWEIFLAEAHGEGVGYTMLVYGEPGDAEAAAAITVRPTAELSKCYVSAVHHGTGVAAALIEATVESAAARAVAGVWLGVNKHNARANGFYERSGFRIVGTKHFLLGEELHDDFVRERTL